MIKKYTITEGEKPSEKQLKEVAEAGKHPIVFDDDCPELSPAMMKALKCAVKQRNRRSSLK